LLPKNPPRRKKVPSILLLMLVLLSRKSLFSIFVYFFCPSRLLCFIDVTLTGLTNRRRNSQRM
jgi:hypothetical protein